MVIGRFKLTSIGFYGLPKIGFIIGLFKLPKCVNERNPISLIKTFALFWNTELGIRKLKNIK